MYTILPGDRVVVREDILKLFPPCFHDGLAHVCRSHAKKYHDTKNLVGIVLKMDSQVITDGAFAFQQVLRVLLEKGGEDLLYSLEEAHEIVGIALTFYNDNFGKINPNFEKMENQVNELIKSFHDKQNQKKGAV